MCFVFNVPNRKSAHREAEEESAERRAQNAVSLRDASTDSFAIIWRSIPECGSQHLEHGHQHPQPQPQLSAVSYWQSIIHYFLLFPATLLSSRRQAQNET